MKELTELVSQLQMDVARDRSKKDKKRKDDRDEHVRSKKKKKKKRSKDRRRRRGSSSSRSSTSSGRSSRSFRRRSRRRRRARTRSLESDTDTSSDYVRWRDGRKSRGVQPGAMAKLDHEKFKGGRPALLAFAAKHPGALTAHFVANCRLKLKGAAGMIRRTGDLRDLDLTTWVTHHAGLTETRDHREALTLAQIFDAVQRRDVEHALDVLVMRLQAIQRAKMKGGKWETASRIELITEMGTEVGPAGLASLTS